MNNDGLPAQLGQLSSFRWKGVVAKSSTTLQGYGIDLGECFGRENLHLITEEIRYVKILNYTLKSVRLVPSLRHFSPLEGWRRK